MPGTEVSGADMATSASKWWSPMLDTAPGLVDRPLGHGLLPGTGNAARRCWTMPFDLQPVLKGMLVELRPLPVDDFGVLFAVASDPLIWEQHPAGDRYEEEVFGDFFHDHLTSGGALVARDTRTGSVIGSSRFAGYDEKQSEVEIGWTFLARSHWGGVYNREMKDLMLRHAFRFVRSVVFLVDPQNLRSQRSVEKIGGVRVGSRLDSAGRKSVAYEITASTFERLV